MFLIKSYFQRRAAMELQMLAEVKHYRLMLPTNPYLILVSIHFDRVSKKIEKSGKTLKNTQLQGFGRAQIYDKGCSKGFEDKKHFEVASTSKTNSF